MDMELSIFSCLPHVNFGDSMCPCKVPSMTPPLF